MNPVNYPRTVQILRALGLWLSVLSIGGCVGTETGNPSATRHVSLALKLDSTNSTVAQICTSDCEGSGIRIQSAWLTSDFIELLGCVGRDDSELTAIAWDLLHPKARGFDTQLQEFCGFHLWTRLADSTLGQIPTELDGAALWVLGARADGTSIELQSTASVNFGNQDPARPQTNLKLVLSLDAAAWLAGVDVNSLVPGADGVVHLNSAVNTALLQVLEQQTGDDAMLRPESSDDGVADE